MNKQLPHYQLVINESPESDVQVDFVALVDRPAIQKNFLVFNQAEAPADRFKFTTQDAELRIVIGPAMIPDLPIYRNDDKGEYFVSFTRDTVEAIALKFYKKGFQNNSNLMHQADLQVEGVTFFLSMIRDTPRGMIGLAGDYPEGTWFLGAKIENPAVWDLIQDGTIQGFSVEGIFQYKATQLSAEEIYSQIEQLLSQLPE